MKKTCLFLTLSVALISCSIQSEDVPNDLLVGAWEDSDLMENGDLTQSLIYRFNPDKSIDISRVIVENSTSEIVGYRYHSSGTYVVTGNQISLIETEIYTNNDLEGNYADLADLELSENTSQTKANFTIDNNSETLTLEYGPCGPHQNCLTSQSFKRLE